MRTTLAVIGFILMVVAIFGAQLRLPIDQPLSAAVPVDMVRDDFNFFNATGVWDYHDKWEGAPDPTASNFDSGILTVRSSRYNWNIWTSKVRLEEPMFEAAVKVDHALQPLELLAVVQYEFYAYVFTSGSYPPTWHEHEFGFAWYPSCADNEVYVYTCSTVNWDINQAYVTLPFKTNSGFHVYKAVWREDSIEYYVDGNRILTIKETSMIFEQAYPTRPPTEGYIKDASSLTAIPSATEKMSLVIGYTNWMKTAPSTQKNAQYDWVTISTQRTTTQPPTETPSHLPTLTVGDATMALGAFAVTLALLLPRKRSK